jgi:hypothetical protein
MSESFKNIRFIKIKVIKFVVWIIIKSTKLQLVNLHDSYEVTHKHIMKLDRFDQGMHIFQKRKNGMQTQN